MPRDIYFIETETALFVNSSKKAAVRIAQEQGTEVYKMPKRAWDEVTWDLPTLRLSMRRLDGSYRIA